MAKKLFNPTIEYPNILLVGIHTPYNKAGDIQSYYDEFIHLVESNDIRYKVTHFTKLRSIDPAYFLTKGKLEELVAICKENKIEEVILSEPLSPNQERNLSDALNAAVFDRTRLILEIFEKSATTAEGKTQVSIAMMQYFKTRLAGHGIHMSQQAGQIGVKGPGETRKEKATRYIDLSILQQKRHLIKMAKSRETQRKQRLSRNVPQVCLVGYTNAGKSTILNATTKSNVLAKDKLFATLDTTTRELYIKGVKKGVISDTVGFIQMLPHNLIEAFKSTLSELQYADLLLHVIDASDQNIEYHIQVVMEILEELGLGEKQILHVFNKADRLENPDQELQAMLDMYQPNVIVSAKTKKELAPLLDYLATWNTTKKA
ncbi:GTPase HflX [bacterium]|jgi:GTPase|nr:GTPase HflX [bacterium]MBT3903542.1 GTPase HflX [bacterium]MBT4577602.1 GTPase HflX [bacterium]MBT5346138.1 GTPase HflX [bacterium]MBT6131407.1 GTPase HflX [bacterium]